MEPVQNKSSFWCCCCFAKDPSPVKRRPDEKSALMGHVDAAARETKRVSVAEAEKSTVTSQASYSPPATPPSRPATPDSAYGDGIVHHGTIGEASPGKSNYGQGATGEDGTVDSLADSLSKV